MRSATVEVVPILGAERVIAATTKTPIAAPSQSHFGAPNASV